jgi:hypothetical protein
VPFVAPMGVGRESRGSAVGAKRKTSQCFQYMTAIHCSLQGLHQEMGVNEGLAASG